MLDFGEYSLYIFASYGLSALVIAALIIRVLRK